MENSGRRLRPYVIASFVLVVFWVLRNTDVDLAQEWMIAFMGFVTLFFLGIELRFAYQHGGQHISGKVFTRKEKPLAFWANVSACALFFAVIFYFVVRAVIRLAIGITGLLSGLT